MKNYTLVETKYIEEIESEINVYSHNKTKARVCTIKNNDENKVFLIGFRTPAINNCGLTHILEHSVLCGSKKYPVKDPFVELLKSSLNTFLNAFTFPDKTCYPVASQNLSDFKNLMDVYLDAVFHPAIYEHEEIFRQEGWHYHILDENEPVTYNGVVYNEMKGAFSNPSDIVTRLVGQYLFPDTSYGFESGGDPKYIPDLDYNEFLNFHSKYYSPSNSYIYIYGNLDMEERLDYLDKEYLSKYDYIDFDTTLKDQKPFEKPVYASSTYALQQNESLDNKDFLTYNVALPSKLEMLEKSGLSIVVNALFNVPGAPLKQKIIDKGLADDVEAYFETELYQPMLSIKLSNSNKNKFDEFIKLIDDEFGSLTKKLDKNLIASVLKFYSFKSREKLFSMRFPKGLSVILGSLATWLYDDKDAYSALEEIKYYDELNNKLNTNYFEELINKYFVLNNHKAYISLVASHEASKEADEELKQKLEAFKNSLSKEELKALVEKNKKLIEYQNSGDTKEALATLPKLKLSDISREPIWGNLEKKDNYLFSNYNTNGISYVSFYFDVTNMEDDDVKYLSLYSNLFAKIPTKNKSYLDISNYILNNAGEFNSEFSVFTTSNGEVKKYFRIYFSCLTKDVDRLNEFLKEILNETNFDDEKSLIERITELKIQAEQSISYSGHVFAANRAYSKINLEFYYKDLVSGLSYIDFVNELIKNFDSLKSNLINKLKNAKNYFGNNNSIVGFVGSNEDLASAKNNINSFVSSLNNVTLNGKTKFNLVYEAEAIKTAYNVNYNALVSKVNNKYNGKLILLAQILSYNYMWQNIRVLGGAYGAFIRFDQNGYIQLGSYRDPNLKKTYETYNNIIEYISKLDLTDEELLSFKIGAMSNLNMVMHNKDLGVYMQKNYLMGRTYDAYKNVIEELLNADLNSLKVVYKDLDFTKSSKTTLGNEKNIEENLDLFNKIRNLGV